MFDVIKNKITKNYNTAMGLFNCAQRVIEAVQGATGVLPTKESLERDYFSFHGMSLYVTYNDKIDFTILEDWLELTSRDGSYYPHSEQELIKILIEKLQKNDSP